MTTEISLQPHEVVRGLRDKYNTKSLLLEPGSTSSKVELRLIVVGKKTDTKIKLNIDGTWEAVATAEL